MQCRVAGIIAVVLVLLGTACWVRAEATLLQQTQAAEVMGGLLTYDGDAVTAQRDGMREYLDGVGKLEDFAANRPWPGQRRDVAFTDMFRGAVLYVQQHGAGMADESLARMKASKLWQELAAAQHYNQEQFVGLNRGRNEIGSMRAYLERTGQWDGYRHWAQNRAEAAPSADREPTTRSAQGVADWIAHEIGDIKAGAWERAQATGTSRPDFEAQWQKSLAEMRQRVASRVAMMNRLAAPAESDTIRTGIWAGWRRAARRGTAGDGLAAAFAAVPMGPQDPRWRAYYFGPERLYSSWNGQYPEIYRPGIAGGTFSTFDLRVNTSFDMRVNGILDRRENTAGDRRLNFREDPRIHTGYGS